MVEAAAIVIQRERAGTARRRMRDAEGPIHRSVAAYLRRSLPAGWIVTHAANKPRSAQQGAREKAMGATAGWPDLQILGPGPSGPSAWFMEVKAPGGKVSDAQREVHDRLMDAGFGVRIVRSVEDARKAVADWHLPSTDSLIVQRQA